MTITLNGSDLTVTPPTSPSPMAIADAQTLMDAFELVTRGDLIPAGGDLDGMRALRGQVRVAGGEMARTPAELLDALEASALDVLQPDVVLSVGMLRARTIAELALLRHRWFTPHTWTNGLGLLANLHVVAGVGGGPYIEFPWDPPGWTEERRDFFLAEPVRIDPDGSLTVPAVPGLGARIDHDAVAHYTRTS